MKILQISNYLYPHIGGIEQVARDLADALSKNKTVDQMIICFNEDASLDDSVCRRKETVRDEVDGVPVVRCGCFAKISSQSLSFSYPFQLKKCLNDFKPNVVVLHYPNPFVSSFLLQMLPNDVTFILYWHLDIIKQKILGKLFHRQTMHLLMRADKVVATSPNYIDGSPYLSMFRDKCTVIPNCIRPDRLKMTAKSSEIEQRLKKEYCGKTICFAVGRHVPYKGMEYLIKASEYLDDSYVVIMGGNGELTGKLKEIAAGNGRIVFAGRIPGDEIAGYYRACDIFAFPSVTKNEAFGIALAEAMYFGKPAVTFTIPGSGVNYVSLNSETGIECPNRDCKAFAEAIRLLGSNPDKREKMGLNAKKRVCENFLFEKFSDSAKKLFNL